MAQVESEKRDAEDVETGNQRVLEAKDYHFVDIKESFKLAALGNRPETWISDAQGVVEQVENYKRQDCEAAQGHCPRRDPGLHVVRVLV